MLRIIIHRLPSHGCTPDGRGNLCKDCGTVYRQVYRAVMRQPTFLNFLEDRRIEYMDVLLAYVSLCMERS